MYSEKYTELDHGECSWRVKQRDAHAGKASLPRTMHSALVLQRMCEFVCMCVCVRAFVCVCVCVCPCVTYKGV